MYSRAEACGRSILVVASPLLVRSADVPAISRGKAGPSSIKPMYEENEIR
jgi:hypothetical protein